MKRIVVISDLQIPYHDKGIVKKVINFIESYKPDEIVSVGDEVDFPQISRWNKNTAMEFEGSLQTHVDEGVKVLENIREAAGDVPFHITRSNHMDRPLAYVRKYAPGLMGLRALTIPSLLDFERLGITYHERPFEVAPNWLLVHGDEGASVAPTPGGTALRLARKFGKSVVCGHTHKAGITHDHSMVGGRITRTLYGFEVGNLMDVRKASYLGGGFANWQTSIGVMYVDGRHVTPSLIPINQGRFVVEGKIYS